MARLNLLLGVIRRDLGDAAAFISGFSKDRRPFDRVTVAWRELNAEDPRVAGAIHSGLRELEVGLPSDPDRMLEEYRVEMDLRAALLPEGIEVKTFGDIREASDKVITRLALELRPEDFTE